MISFAEIEIALLGLLRLARFDGAFAGFFDLSQQGARRSFRLALWLLPVVFLLMNLNSKWTDETDIGRVLFGQLIVYSLGWTCFSLLLVYVAPMIDRRSRIYGAIAIYNWLTLLSVALQAPIAIAIYYGLDLQWASALSDIALLFVTACEFFAFQRLLELRIGLTIALVGFDFVLGRILELLNYGLIHDALF